MYLKDGQSYGPQAEKQLTLNDFSWQLPVVKEQLFLSLNTGINFFAKLGTYGLSRVVYTKVL